MSFRNPLNNQTKGECPRPKPKFVPEQLVIPKLPKREPVCYFSRRMRIEHPKRDIFWRQKTDFDERDAVPDTSADKIFQLMLSNPKNYNKKQILEFAKSNSYLFSDQGNIRLLDFLLENAPDGPAEPAVPIAEVRPEVRPEARPQSEVRPAVPEEEQKIDNTNLTKEIIPVVKQERNIIADLAQRTLGWAIQQGRSLAQLQEMARIQNQDIPSLEYVPTTIQTPLISSVERQNPIQIEYRSKFEDEADAVESPPLIEYEREMITYEPESDQKEQLISNLIDDIFNSPGSSAVFEAPFANKSDDEIRDILSSRKITRVIFSDVSQDKNKKWNVSQYMEQIGPELRKGKATFSIEPVGRDGARKTYNLYVNR